MATYKTPGVYVEEISTLPPSVAEVSTAIPAFIGCTEKGPKNQPTRISTMLDYEESFGGPQPTAFTATITGDGSVSISRTAPAAKDFLMYYCLRMYFNNGGGPCYIVSVGNYSALPGVESFEDGLDEVAKEDEPTLILLTDAVNLSAPDYYSLCQKTLAQCGKLRDRFAIFDVLEGDKTAVAFRHDIGTSDLKYGAAYYPYLQTSLSYVFQESRVSVLGLDAAAPAEKKSLFQRDFGGLRVTYEGNAVDVPRVQVTLGDTSDVELTITDTLNLKITNVRNGGENSAAKVVDAWGAKRAENIDFAPGFDIEQPDSTNDTVESTGNSSQPLTLLSTPESSTGTATGTLAGLKESATAEYNRIKSELAKQRVVLPPSGAIAGIYAKTDRERGVWKAPANVSVASIIGPTVKITHDEQEGLNVHPTAGKSINAIRSFVGKGTLVWGARTLAGNDNEWRYVNVRRLFNMIEESTRKATAFAVFEANDATTWLKVKGMIESFLYGLWEQGALAGPTPESAYFVNIGLGKTMTTQDVLEGRMIVEIGVAAVRPAEFIILRFTHKLQEA